MHPSFYDLPRQPRPRLREGAGVRSAVGMAIGFGVSRIVVVHMDGHSGVLARGVSRTRALAAAPEHLSIIVRRSARSTGVWCTPSPAPRPAQRSPAIPSEALTRLPKEGAGNPNIPPGGTGGVPLYPKTSEGGAGGIAAHAKPDPPLKKGASHNKTTRPTGASCPTPLPSGRLASAQTRQRKLAPAPQQGAGGAAPAGGQGCPPVPQNVGGRSGRDSGVRQARPSVNEGAHHSNPPLPQRGAGSATPAGVARAVLKRPIRRVQGTLVPAGGQRVPLFPKTSEGGAGGMAAPAKPDPPLKEGARQAKPFAEGGRWLQQEPPPKEGAGHNKTPIPPAECKKRSPRRGYSVYPCF